ncbi:response regulator transcription factor [Planomonospora venezuelensis]|uniref:DNA-binding response OmpR family regulator n=1 Tax=Planomonospora venezuelensis TaxID=1999 RepID=A0A841D3K5_PLAVE|nr:response regulator transcription factor [Planomonospora venezuelensis]MBB5962745.1 DNA-binding response OmpR family regulator [Planomonospora venezuelensis]GIM99459.1 hypothetical protein Pve01_11180 [Planomonospora venezuelensis]
MPVALVVEDDPDHQNLLVILLERAGFEVHAVANGTEAVPAAHDVRPDLMVLDWQLPGMAGLEVCRRLRAAPDTAGVAVLMVTAWVDNDVEKAMREACQAGADDFILKPINHHEFIARVLALLDRYPASEDGSGAARGAGKSS